MTSPSSTRQPPETARLVWRVFGFTVGVSLAISNIQWLVFIGAFILSATATLSANKHQTIKLIPGLLLIFTFVTMMLFLVVVGTRVHSDDALLHRLYPWYVCVMIGMWGVVTILDYRKWRASKSDKQP